LKSVRSHTYIRSVAKVAPNAFPFHCRLFGGVGSGLTVALAGLDERIKVFKNGGPAFGVRLSEPDPANAELIGIYEMAGPLGPETPIYVPAGRE
jgi:hypothetical protein